MAICDNTGRAHAYRAHAQDGSVCSMFELRRAVKVVEHLEGGGGNVLPHVLAFVRQNPELHPDALVRVNRDDVTLAPAGTKRTDPVAVVKRAYAVGLLPVRKDFATVVVVPAGAGKIEPPYDCPVLLHGTDAGAAEGK